jgi:hypothetical protein
MDGQENARLTRSVEPEAEQTSSGPRFARFVAAIEAFPPPQAQLLKEPRRSVLQQAPSAKATPSVSPPITARSGAGARMLRFGIGSLAVFGLALVASLFQWPDRDVADRVIGARSDSIQHRTVLSGTREDADHDTVNQLKRRPLPKSSAVPLAAVAGSHLDTRPAPRRVADGVLGVAEPVASDPDSRVSGVPPRPRLKPPINHMTAAAPHDGAEN